MRPSSSLSLRLAGSPSDPFTTTTGRPPRACATASELARGREARPATALQPARLDRLDEIGRAPGAAAGPGDRPEVGEVLVEPDWRARAPTGEEPRQAGSAVPPAALGSLVMAPVIGGLVMLHLRGPFPRRVRFSWSMRTSIERRIDVPAAVVHERR